MNELKKCWYDAGKQVLLLLLRTILLLCRFVMNQIRCSDVTVQILKSLR